LRLRRDAHSRRFLAGLDRVDAAFDLEPHLGWLAPSSGAKPVGPIARALERHTAACDVMLLGGDPALERFMRRLGARLRASGIAVAFAPAAELVDRAARVMVGAAGFNLSYETVLSGVHHLAIPRPRPFDDQERRARAIAEVPPTPTALERRVRTLLADDREREVAVDFAALDELARIVDG
jgi:hypothetical protein